MSAVQTKIAYLMNKWWVIFFSCSRTGQPEQGSQNRTARVEKPGQDCKDWAAKTETARAG
jgi:hypothetical protein